jgi:metal-responsive CopG/Arc/MetJ family transcriptional regulator
VVYLEPMRTLEKSVRQSISLPPRVARQVQALAQRKNASTNRVIVDLIQSGLDAQEQEKKRFFELANRLARSANVAEQKRIKEELARMTFGE